LWAGSGGFGVENSLSDPDYSQCEGGTGGIAFLTLSRGSSRNFRHKYPSHHPAIIQPSSSLLQAILSLMVGGGHGLKKILMHTYC